MDTIINNITAEKSSVDFRSHQKSSRLHVKPSEDSFARIRFVVSHGSIDVKLISATPISALRVEIEFQEKLAYRPITFSPRIQGLNTYINFEEAYLTFIVLDIDSKGIAPGDGTIVSIPIDDQQEFQVKAAYASARTTGIKEIEYLVVNENAQDCILLEQNDPNPFSSNTKIEFQIADEAEAKIVIYDVGGALVRTLLDSKLESGTHTAGWDGRDDNGDFVESGIYLYKLYAGVYSVTRRMVYLK